MDFLQSSYFQCFISVLLELLLFLLKDLRLYELDFWDFLFFFWYKTISEQG